MTKKPFGTNLVSQYVFVVPDINVLVPRVRVPNIDGDFMDSLYMPVSLYHELDDYIFGRQT